MVETGKELKLFNVLSKRTKILQTELSFQMEEIKAICNSNSFHIKSITTVTFKIEETVKGQLFDIEFLIEVQNKSKELHIPDGFILKEKIYLTNALKLHYVGPSSDSNKAFTEINNYLLNNKLVPITPAYSVNKTPFTQSEALISFDIFVGLNPNIL